MLRDVAACRENHERFISRVLASQVVWGLKAARGFADCDSNESDGPVLMFWSDRAYATRVRQQSFPEYEPEEITLFDFLFRWLPGMAKDGVLAGTNWPGDLVGLEIAPMELRETILSVMPPEQFQEYKARLDAGLKDRG
jgi:hypothetical protein